MISRIRIFLSALLRRSRLEDGIHSELRFHIDAYIADLTAKGVSHTEAERRARMEFGCLDAVREECREAVGLRLPDELRRNVRYAFRMFRKAPAFTATALITLALCIGANTAIFSVVDAVLLRPLPYPRPEKLFSLGWSYKDGTHADTNDGHTWFLVRDHAGALEAAPFSFPTSFGVNFVSGKHAEYVPFQRVGGGFFHVLGVEPMIGREFTESEDRFGGPAVTVLSYDFWKRVFNADPSALGRPVLLRGEPHTVIGIMPPGFRSNQPADLWTPLRPSTTGEGSGQNYGIVVRPKHGVSMAQAAAEVRSIGEASLRHLNELGFVGADAGARIRLVPLQHTINGELRIPLILLWTAVAVVLLIGCINIAGLLLAQGASRRREIATRIALGGGRAAVIRQLLTESLILGLCGGLLGVFVGYGGVIILRHYAAQTLGIWQTVELNARVLAAIGASALLTSVLFGLAPAIEATRADVRDALAEGGTRGVAGGMRAWPRRLLVIGEVSLSFVLLVGAGLLIRTLFGIMQITPGFDPANVLAAKISLQDARYSSSADVNRLFDQSLMRIHRIPGVRAAAVGLSLPYQRPLNDGFRRLDGPHADGPKDYQQTSLIYITPEYFQVLRVPLLQGRAFTDADGAKSAPVCIVNRAFVQTYLRGQDPITSHIGSGRISQAIIGVVGDVPQTENFGTSFQAPAPSPTVYIPAKAVGDAAFQLLHVWFTPSWIVRYSGPSRALIPKVTRSIESIDPLLPFAGFEMLDDLRADSARGHRFLTMLLGSLAALALLLAAIGIYGLISNSVAMRWREIGIRLALGATLPDAARTLALPGICLSLAGVLLGAGLSTPAARVLNSLLFHVSPADPITFAATGFGLLLVAAVASCLPALRLRRLNPAETLRHE